jgi:tight adherence protein B
MGINPIFVAIFVGALVVFGALAFAMGGGASDALQKRIAKVSGATKRTSSGPAAVSLRRRHLDLPESTSARLISRIMPGRMKVAMKLAQAGKSTTPEKFGMICIIVALVAAFVMAGGLKLPVYVALPAGAVLGILLPWFILGRMAAKRSKRFLEAFPDAIDLLVRSVRVGLPIGEAIAIGGRDLPDPVGTEFGRMANSMRLGRSFEDSMWDVATQIEISEFNFFATSITVQRETGGNIAETLSNLSGLIRARHQMKKKVKALSAEARASAWIVGSLPFAIFGILFLANPQYIMPLIDDVRGNILLGMGLTSQAIGVAIMAKLTRFEI